MATITEKLKKKGWSVKSTMGWKGGSQSIIGYVATKGQRTVRATTLTELQKHCG